MDRIRPTGRGLADAAQALKLAQGRRPELVALLERLIMTPSPQHTSAGDVQQVVARYLEANGYHVERRVEDPLAHADHAEFQPPPEGTRDPVNVIGRTGAGPQARVAMFAHIDTESVGPGWTRPPLVPCVHEGRMYGLGAADDKGGVAAMLVASALLRESGRPTPLVMCLHGKGGGARGSLPVFVRRPDLHAALYVHPAETGNGMAEIKHVSRGALDVTLTVRGWRGRQREIGTASSAPFEEGGDALKKCLEVVEAFRQVVSPVGELNLGRIRAGDGPETVPDVCQAEMRVLFREPATITDLLAEFRKRLGPHGQAASSGERFELSVELSGTRANPASVDWDHPVCKVLRATVEQITGRAPVAYAGHTSSDIRFPILLCDVPALGIGSRGGSFYGADEWVDLDDLIGLVAVLMTTVSALAAQPGGAGSIS